MKLIDRISLQRLITLLLNFIITVIKIFAPKTNDTPIDKKVRRPRWRRNK